MPRTIKVTLEYSALMLILRAFVFFLYPLTAALLILAQNPTGSFQLTNATGLRLSVDEENDMPTLRILLPTQPDSEPGIWVLFPEHVAARETGKPESRQLYLFRPGRQASHTNWR